MEISPGHKICIWVLDWVSSWVSLYCLWLGLETTALGFSLSLPVLRSIFDFSFYQHWFITWEIITYDSGDKQISKTYGIKVRSFYSCSSLSIWICIIPSWTRSLWWIWQEAISDQRPKQLFFFTECLNSLGKNTPVCNRHPT